MFLGFLRGESGGWGGGGVSGGVLGLVFCGFHVWGVGLGLWGEKNRTY